jgi:hypothetical protein
VVGVVPDAEVALDHLRDAGGRPEIGPVPLGQRAPEQQPDELPALPRGQLRGPARGAAYPEPALAAAAHGVAP